MAQQQSITPAARNPTESRATAQQSGTDTDGATAVHHFSSGTTYSTTTRQGRGQRRRQLRHSRQH